MGLIITAQVQCDNCNGQNTPNAVLASQDSPLPPAWCRVQGYATITEGDAEPLDGFFCPVCVNTQGTKQLVKKTADISQNLTAANNA